MAEPQALRTSYAECLEAEEACALKHEYLRGEVYAMAGGAPKHAALSMSLGVELEVGLRGRPCQVYSSDLRVRIEATDLSSYPDLVVSCGVLETSERDANAAANPLLIVEVLSESTEGYERGEKFAHYRQIPRLREYVPAEPAARVPPRE